jgi:molybdate transport system ATP-binding protein
VRAAGPTAQILSDPGLVPIFGAGEAGALITARVVGREGDGLTRCDTAGGPVFLPGPLPAPGRSIRLRVRAQDVMLATGPLTGISALNLLSAVVARLDPDGETGMVVTLDLGGEQLLARIIRRSAAALALAPGVAVQAILKTVALAGS